MNVYALKFNHKIFTINFFINYKNKPGVIREKKKILINRKITHPKQSDYVTHATFNAIPPTLSVTFSPFSFSNLSFTPCPLSPWTVFECLLVSHCVPTCFLEFHLDQSIRSFHESFHEILTVDKRHFNLALIYPSLRIHTEHPEAYMHL